MKKLKYVLLGALISAVVSTSVVIPTLSWLSSLSDEVVNSFEGGEVKIKMDESPVDNKGKKTTGNRVKENNYKFVAGSELDKDPTPTVLKGSIPSYIFVSLENVNSDVFSTNVDESKWLKVCEKDGKTLYAYNKIVDASEAAGDVVLDPLFTQVKVSEALTSEKVAELKASDPKQFIKTQTFAIQSEVIDKNVAIRQAVDQFGLTGATVTYVNIAAAD